jgi:CubicO group peptidase (beta-lactamase class C family)
MPSRRKQSSTRRLVGLLIALVLCGLPLGARSRAAPEPERAQRLEAALRELEARRMPVIVAVSHAGGPPLVRAFGSAASGDVPAASRLVDVNSITKTVTAIMAAKLVERGALRFDATLAQIFADVPADKAALTVHHLLTHTAGLPESVGEDAECLDKQAFLERVLHAPLGYPVGAYHYSNAGYGLVAAIVEARAGKSYEAFLQEDILHDLGIADTGYSSVYDDARSLRTAHGATIARASWGGHAPGWNLIGNGGLISTVSDMIRFRHAVVAGRVLGRDVLDQVHTPHVREDEGDSFYGYGLVVQDIPGIGRVYWHDGGNDVFSAQWADYVDHEDVVFTAGADSARGDAFVAMEIIAKHLYDVAEAN